MPLLGGALTVGLGLAFVVRPGLLAARFKAPLVVEGDLFTIGQGLSVAIGIALIAFGLVPLLRQLLRIPASSPWLPIAATVVAYLALAHPLANWLVDDAAITFAYSENLVRGYGLTLHPSLAPEEGYSNTSWMLWLAGLRVLGFDLPGAAKVSCLFIGALTCAIVHLSALKLQRSADGSGEGAASGYRWLVPALGLLGAPYLVWSVSGLEHALQALVIVCAAVSPLFLRRPQLASALSLAMLVLTRPEAPLFVAICFGIYVAYERAERGWLGAVKSSLVVAALPAVVWIGLTVFRVAYFGDPMSNPYYAKAGDATVARLFNVVGGGWDYVLTWAFGSGVLVTLPAIARRFSRPVHVAVALALGQIATQFAFAIYALGDKMGCWRFVSPALPALAFVFAWALTDVPQPEPKAQTTASWRDWVGGRVLLGVSLLLLGLGATKQYLVFLAQPTTPYATVAAVGEHFAELGRRLGLKDPILAHHDAGGTSYKARIHLLDLAGLGTRAIAKHIKDAPFLSNYILNEVPPDFVFGVANDFAAGNSLFWQRPEFNERYVRLEFANDAKMNPGLCHIKRSLVAQGPLPPGVSVVQDNGVITKVVVN